MCQVFGLFLISYTTFFSLTVNGSDYPLPAINIVVHTKKLVKMGFITSKERKILNEIYDYNPLLFDMLLKVYIVCD